MCILLSLQYFLFLNTILKFIILYKLFVHCYYSLGVSLFFPLGESFCVFHSKLCNPKKLALKLIIVTSTYSLHRMGAGKFLVNLVGLLT